MPGIRPLFQWPAGGIVNVRHGTNKAPKRLNRAAGADFFASAAVIACPQATTLAQLFRRSGVTESRLDGVLGAAF
jgi:hypothetical protein